MNAEMAKPLKTRDEMIKSLKADLEVDPIDESGNVRWISPFHSIQIKILKIMTPTRIPLVNMKREFLQWFFYLL